MSHHVSDLLVEVFHHVAEITCILTRRESALVIPVPIMRIRSSHMRRMYKRLSEIQHERLAFFYLAVDIIKGIILHGIRSVWTIFISLSVIVVIAVCKTVCLMHVTALLIKFHLSEE